MRKRKIVARLKKYVLLIMLTTDLVFKAKVVYLILSKDTDAAFELLSQRYNVVKPKLKVGMPKRYSKNPACYVSKYRMIHVSCRENLWNPHMILHEFYHHLRNVKDAQGGIEKYADKFAADYMRSYQKLVTCET
jgi:hypothetical protein